MTEDLIKIANPLLSETSSLRDNIWQEHLRIINRNIKAGQTCCWIFEIGNRYKKSKGEIIAFLDSDDWWNKDKLYYSIRYLMKGYEFIYHDLYKSYTIRSMYDLLGFKQKLKTRSLKKQIFEDLFFNSNGINR